MVVEVTHRVVVEETGQVVSSNLPVRVALKEPLVDHYHLLLVRVLLRYLVCALETVEEFLYLYVSPLVKPHNEQVSVNDRVAVPDVGG